MDQAQTPLEELMAATAKGDRAAFHLLYKRTSAKLFGVILRILKNKELSEDVLQDVFLKVWKKADTYNPSAGKPVTWMATIARNRAIDVIRATRPTRSLDMAGDEEEIFKLGAHDAKQLDFEDIETLRYCLGEMDRDLRNYVLLAYYDGYSREELAQKYSIPSGTIKTRLRRGLLALRACLDIK